MQSLTFSPLLIYQFTSVDLYVVGLVIFRTQHLVDIRTSSSFLPHTEQIRPKKGAGAAKQSFFLHFPQKGGNPGRRSFPTFLGGDYGLLSSFSCPPLLSPASAFPPHAAAPYNPASALFFAAEAGGSLLSFRRTQAATAPYSLSPQFTPLFGQRI